MLRRLLCLVAVVVLAGACVSPPEDVDTVPNFDPEETRMGVIQDRGVLRVGLPDEPRPPFSFPVAPSYDGFIVDLATEIATALDVAVEFDPVPQDELLALETVEGKAIDLGFPIVPLTEKLVRKYPFTHPYFVSHQRLLVRNGSGVADVENLGGHTVCAVVDRDTSVKLAKLNPESQVLETSDAGECALLLQNGKVEVVSATDVQLMAIWATVTDCTQPCPPSEDFTLLGDEISTVGMGAVVRAGGGWTNFVNATWAETDAEGRWLELFEEWIEPYGLSLDEAPVMTVEEAAGLFPCEDRACKKSL